MKQTILFQAKGGINKKSTVSITLYDKIDDDRPYVLQVITSSYDEKQKEYLICNTSTMYFYNYAEALEQYIENVQCKICYGYSIRSFQNKPVIVNL